MKDFHSESRGGSRGGRRFNNRGGSRFGSGNRQDRSLHDAVCSDCGKNCQVPFKPTGQKPVLCKECFSKSPNKNKSGAYGRDNQEQKRVGSNDYQKQFDEINEKLETILSVVLQLKNDFHKPTISKVLSDDLKS